MQTQYRKSDIVDLDNLQNTYENTEHDILNNYMPFHISGLQHYNPIYSCFFELNDSNVGRTTLKHKYAIHDLQTVMDTETGELIPKSVFIKFSPLLDPIKYMIGKYNATDDAIRTLPTLPNAPVCHTKLADRNNASYTDCFFSYLSSQLLHRHGLVNAVDFYGSYLGVQEKYKMNISDDIEYLCTSRYFNENVGKLFKISEEIPSNGNYGDGSRGNKPRLNIQGSLKTHNISLIDLDVVDLDNDTYSGSILEVSNEHGSSDIKSECECETTLQDNNTGEVIYEKSSSHSLTESSESSNNSSLNYSTDDDVGQDESDEDDDVGQDESDEDDDVGQDESGEDDDEESSEDESDDDDVLFSYMDNFPIQMICLEKCEGTIDELFEKGALSKKEGAAALIQIVMTLIAYQRAFSFTHNDLHTNNIMYVTTDKEFLYYRYNKKTYKVPTYGRIFKIIDFGRSIYRFSGKTFCSDSFAPGGDAATQYNCEPYMNEEKARLDPNPSFDLCRLGCSIYDFLIEDETEEDMDIFQKTIYRWCCDDNRKNILYKRDGDERYPNFKLYKMIARSVHKHSPQAQLDYPFFGQFALSAKEVKKVAKESLVMDIDEIPSYM
jgi:hypothetical protein